MRTTATIVATLAALAPSPTVGWSCDLGDASGIYLVSISRKDTDSTSLGTSSPPAGGHRNSSLSLQCIPGRRRPVAQRRDAQRFLWRGRVRRELVWAGSNGTSDHGSRCGRLPWGLHLFLGAMAGCDGAGASRSRQLHVLLRRGRRCFRAHLCGRPARCKHHATADSGRL